MNLTDIKIEHIPFRSMLIAPKGKLLVQADLSQAESWIVAFLAREPSMKHSLMNSDIHTDTAMALFDCARESVTKPMRYIGKRNNHAKAYRMKFPRMAQVINKDSDKAPYVTVTLSEAKKYSEAWERKYCYVPVWWKEIEYQLNIDRTLVTPYGRSRTFYERWGDELFKEATAYVPQSTVADHFYGLSQDGVNEEGGLLRIHEDIELKYDDIKIVNTAHDSVILEVPKDSYKDIAEEVRSRLLRPLVINGEQFTIPVDIEYGERNGEFEKLIAA